MPDQDNIKLLLERLAALEERNTYLEDANRATLDALELAVSIGDFGTPLNELVDQTSLLNEAGLRAKKLIKVKSLGFFLINEETSFPEPALFMPENKSSELETEFLHLIENQTVSWLMDSHTPYITRCVKCEGTLLVHSLSTLSRVRGFFICMLNQDRRHILDSSLYLLSVVMRHCANAIESYELYKLHRSMTQELEQKVYSLGELTQDLEVQNRIANAYLKGSEDEVYKSVFAILMELFDCALGYLAYMSDPDTLTVRKLELDASGRVQIDPEKFDVHWVNIQKSWETVLYKRTTLYFNTPQDGVDATSVNNLLLTPIVENEQSVGLFALGNKEGDFTPQDKQLIQEFRAQISLVLYSRLDRNIQELRRQEVEAALRDSEQRLRWLIDHMPILVHAHDKNGRYVFWNEESEKILGYTADEVKRDPDIIKRLYPDPKVHGRIKGRPEGGMADERWEARVVTKDGAEKIISWTSRSAESVMMGWHCWETGVDITARKHEEEKLRERNKELMLQLGARAKELDENSTESDPAEN